MFSDDDLQKLVVSVDGKKVSVASDSDAINHLASNLPADAAELLASLQGQITPPQSTIAVVSPVTTEIFAKLPTGQEQMSANGNVINISETTPFLGYIIEKEIKENLSPESQSMIRARSAEMQIAHERQNALDEIKNAIVPIKKFTIYECGVALGIIVGSTKRTEVSEIMKNYSKVVCSDSYNDLMFYYHDIQVTIFYNDDLVVSEIQFGDFYKGQTSKGLQLGDPLEKALELYGPPRMKSPKGAFWNKFGVFCQNNLINKIRIQA